MLDILGVVEGLGRNDVEIVDVIDQHRSKVPIVDLRLDTRHVVYVDKHRYDYDLLAGQRTIIAAYAQLQRDITRCAFAMDGVLTTHIPSSLSSQLVRYCTQAVLALPVEMLTTARVMVCESRERMRVSATSSSVCVSKLVHAMSPCLTCHVEVAIAVRAELAQPFVEVIFDIGRCVSYDSSDPLAHACTRPDMVSACGVPVSALHDG